MHFTINSIIKSNLNINLQFVKRFSKNQRCYTSSLYIPGNKANKEVSILKPNINFDNYFNDIQESQRQLNLRGYQFDLKELKLNWDLYKTLRLKKVSLENGLREYSRQIKNIEFNTNVTSSDTSNKDEILMKCKVLKEDLKLTKENIWNIEETIIPELLKLPNVIDERTPQENPVILKTVGQKPVISKNEILGHICIGKKLGLLEYTSPIQYFLCDEAVLFEYAIIDLSGKILSNIGITRVAGPDFCRSIIVEGAGMDHENSLKTFVIQNTDKSVINKLHLVGSSSLPGLLALYTKRMSYEKNFPIKIFSTGRQYIPIESNSMTYGLFSVCQASVTQTLILVNSKNRDMYENELQSLIEATSKIYDEIGSHYRVVIKPIKELDSSESMRIAFEMWSSYLSEYIEVGHISLSNDYFSKRLMIGCKVSKKVTYPVIITGTLLSVPKVLGCLLEDNPKEFILPEKMKGFLG
jgi:seryl-tRNA synthetase